MSADKKPSKGHKPLSLIILALIFSFFVTSGYKFGDVFPGDFVISCGDETLGEKLGCYGTDDTEIGRYDRKRKTEAKLERIREAEKAEEWQKLYSHALEYEGSMQNAPNTYQTEIFELDDSAESYLLKVDYKLTPESADTPVTNWYLGVFNEGANTDKDKPAAYFFYGNEKPIDLEGTKEFQDIPPGKYFVHCYSLFVEYSFDVFAKPIPKDSSK